MRTCWAACWLLSTCTLLLLQLGALSRLLCLQCRHPLPQQLNAMLHKRPLLL
jgi:hypothetical protein